MNTDSPAYNLGPQESVYAQDLIAPTGVATQRKGWVYDGTTADVAANLIGVWRNKFILADVTRTLTTDAAGESWIHNASAAGTALTTGSVTYLPRCVYRDELIFCATDGLGPIIRYSGAASGPAISASGTTNLTLGEATVTGTLVLASDPGAGSYCFPKKTTSDYAVPTWHRVLESSINAVTMENVTASVNESLTGTQFQGYGYAFAAVPIYAAGTVTFDDATSNLSGFGTKWSTGGTAIRAGVASSGTDGVLILPATGDSLFYSVVTVTDDDDIQAGGGSGASVTDKSNYRITRRLPFTDVAAHKGSLWGTGAAQYPNNVYVGPPNWDLAGPPGFVPPYDLTDYWTSSNANDFLMDSIAVPTAFEGDVNVAILSSPNPLLVLKRSAVYGIFGSYPNFSVDKIADGVGCIDLRSAISGPNGQFWAGEDGIYAYVGGQVIDLTTDKINREWRGLTDGFDFGTSDYCAIGESNDHLLVSIVTDAGTTDRCYVYDLRAQAWISRFSNHKARYFFSSKVDGEASELYWVGDNDQGRVMKSSGALDLTGLAKDGDSTSPRLQAWTGEGMDGTESIDNDARLLDLSVSANVYDAGAAGSTQLAVSVVSGGSLEAQASTTKTLADIDSDAVDRVDRTRYRSVNAKGRLHQVRLDVDTLGTNTAATKVEIPEMSATLRDRRSRT